MKNFYTRLEQFGKAVVALCCLAGVPFASAADVNDDGTVTISVSTTPFPADTENLTPGEQMLLVKAAAQRTVFTRSIMPLADDSDNFDIQIDTVNNYAKIAKYNGTSANVVIPDDVTYDGKTYPVTVVGMQSFVAKTTMKTLTFGRNIKKTESSVFVMCSGLTTLNLNEGLEELGETMCYMSCGNLKSIEFPTTLKIIGDQCFKTAKISGEVILPESLEYLGAGAFMGNPVTGFYFEEDNNPNYTSVDGVLYSKDGKRLLCYPPGLVESTTYLPAGLTEIGEFALYGNSTLKEIVIPESVTFIGDRAFGNCNLQSLTIGPNVDSIGTAVVMSNKNLTTITVSPENKTFKLYDGKYLVNTVTKTMPMTTYLSGDFIVPDGVEVLTDYIAYQNTGITSLKAPASVKVIGNYAFNKCTGMTSVEFPGVERVGEFAFEAIKTITRLDFPNTLEYIGQTAFAYMDGLTEAILPSSLKTMGRTCFYQCLNLKKVSIPGSVTSFGDAIFYQCTALDDVTLGEGMQEIPQMMFYGTSNLTDVKFPSTIKKIGNSAFYASKILAAELPEGLEEIEFCAFYQSWLQRMTIPNSVERIDDFAFSFCAVQDMKCGSGLRYLGNYAFQAMKSCKSIELNEGLEELGNNSIFSCSVLDSITIPSTVTKFGNAVFVKTPLKKMVNLAEVPQTLTEDMTGDPWENWQIYDTMVLQVPEKSLNLYKEAAFWKDYKLIEAIPTAAIDGITSDMTDAEVVGIYSIDGRSMNEMQPGVNIVKYSDGTVRKVIGRK